MLQSSRDFPVKSSATTIASRHGNFQQTKERKERTAIGKQEEF